MPIVLDTGSSTSSFISTNVGQGVTAYLMKQPMEYHEEDLKIQRDQNESRMADLKRELNKGDKGTYGKVDIS